MEMYLWNRFNREEVTPALIYWADYWNEKTPLFGHIEYGSHFENPRTLLKLLRDEINFNGLQSKEMREYLSCRIKFYLKNKYLLNDSALNYFQLLNSAIRAGGTDLTYATASECEAKLASGDLVRHLVSRLKEVAFNSGDLAKIRLIVDSLIIEFLLAGYGSKYIENVPRRVLSFYTDLGPGTMTTDFPHTVKFEEFRLSDGTPDFETYHSKVREQINTLSLSDRITAIERCYFHEEEELTFIFPLRGVRAESGEARIGDVHIYSPKSFNYTSDKSRLRKNDSFRDFAELPITAANAAVPIKTRDPESSKFQALEKIREALNLLHFYLPSNAEVSAEARLCHAVSKDGMSRWEASSVDKKSDIWFWNDKSVDIRDLNISMNNGREVFANFFRQERSDLRSFAREQVTHALHFLDKAHKSETPEDRLVNLWVCLEKLVADRKTLFSLDKSKYELIADLLPPLVLGRLHDKAWSCFNFLRSRYHSFHGPNRLLPLDPQLAREIHFESERGNTINIKSFIDNLDQVIASTDREILKEKLVELKSFYFENKGALKIFSDDAEIVKRDILLIYRLRNKIVHDASFDAVPIEIWANRLESYVRLFLGSVLKNYSVSDERIHDFLVRSKVEFDYKIQRLSNSPALRVYDLVFT